MRDRVECVILCRNGGRLGPVVGSAEPLWHNHGTSSRLVFEPPSLPHGARHSTAFRVRIHWLVYRVLVQRK